MYWIVTCITFVLLATFYSGLLFIFKLLKTYLANRRQQTAVIYIEHLSWWLSLTIAFSVSTNFFISAFEQADYSIYLHKLINIILTLLALKVFLQIIKATEVLVHSRIDLHKADNLQARGILTRFEFIKKVLFIIGFTVAFSIILLNFDRVKEIGLGVLASAGLLTAIVGFAAQKSIANLLAGFQVAFTQPIRLDDVVIVEGEYGRVEHISLTYVVVRIWDKRRLVLPMNYFLEKPFQNWTRVSADLIGSIYLYADYSVDLNLLEQELKNLLEENSLWDGEVANLQVTDCKSHYIELRALVSAADSAKLWDLRCQIRQGLIRFLQREQPYALTKRRTLNLNPTGIS